VNTIGNTPAISPVFLDEISQKPIDKNPIKSWSSYIKNEFSNIEVEDSDSESTELFTEDPLINRNEVQNRQKHSEFQQRSIDIFNEVKRESEEARLLDKDIKQISNLACDDFNLVMKEIYNSGVPIPEVTWNEDGSLDIGWSLKTGGSSTILVYGDDHVIYNTYLGPDNYVRSVCKISDDNVILPKLIEMLSGITTT